MNQIIMPSPGPVVEGLEHLENVIAKDQPEYLPLRALCSQLPAGMVLTRWTPDERQRAAIAVGADIFLESMTFKMPLQPILMRVAWELNKQDVLNYLGLQEKTTAS
jgi:hypothetical protein